MSHSLQPVYCKLHNMYNICINIFDEISVTNFVIHIVLQYVHVCAEFRWEASLEYQRCTWTCLSHLVICCTCMYICFPYKCISDWEDGIEILRSKKIFTVLHVDVYNSTFKRSPMVRILFLLLSINCLQVDAWIFYRAGIGLYELLLLSEYYEYWNN